MHRSKRRPYSIVSSAQAMGGRDNEAEDLRRFKIDDKLKINRLHDRPAFGRASCLKSKPGIFFILHSR